MGAPDSPVRQPRHPTVGALTSGATGQSLFTVWCAFCACSDSARAVRALFTHCSLLQTTVGAVSRCSAWHTGQSDGL
jgi:hypothetical protein